MSDKPSHFAILSDIVHEVREHQKNYRAIAVEVKKIAESLLGSVEVMVFGSVVKGKAGPNSDIDILILSKNMPKDYREQLKIKAQIRSHFPMLVPLQLHLVTPEEYEQWYSRFIKEDYEKI
ncbi:MAG TPA: nucleotidyltransferase domain-containing protein [Fimbriimonadales bacterium]|nr:nucleotidyltransferase domain-containing protein [Fimbriimonadales bacterium]